MATTDHNGSLIRFVLVALVALLVFPMLMMAFAFPMLGGWMMGGYAEGVPVWGWVVLFVPFGFVVALGYLAYRAFAADEFGGDPALEELRVAYARGDISDEEFEIRRERLQ
ncbi:SHOCT domain-containing protein [Haladaptatus cibarius]|uniref:SHOCT domain-containing protein n=1 Tax=Haladaptatus cibarius TaxID=453847 RepID=UPI000678B0DB|nr:SHOCT domain-containing protein [Haladaptatus cibarius]